MPYADTESRRAVQRESQRRRRAASGKRQPQRQPLPELVELRYRTARDVLALLGDQVAAVLEDEGVGSVEKLRAVSYAGSVMIRAIEAWALEDRLVRVEAALGLRSNGGSYAATTDQD